ncbi:sporulation protein [Geobacillus stearothermophilus]|nr:sporulation protein [Geobacillus stearothermophilus]KFX34614.1 sporulation protein [Geobacillus stearothermophilus]
MRQAVKWIGVLSAAGLLASCANYGANEGAQHYNNATRPIGYYSTERNDDFRYGRYGTNALNYDNNYIWARRGPATDYLADEGRFGGPAATRFDTDVPALPGDVDFGDGDYNYHGHLNSLSVDPHPSYYRSYDGGLAEELSRRAAAVGGVDDARAVVYGDQALIAIATDARHPERLEQRVAKAVAPYADGKRVRVTSNPSMYHRVRTIDNTIRQGGPINMDEIRRDLRTIFIDHDTIQERPRNPR